VPRNVGKYLGRWTEGEQYGAWFDHVEDTVSFAQFQCIDFEGMEQTGPPLEALFFYLFHRMNEIIASPSLATVFKIAVVDEAWLFFKHPVTRAYIESALKTWRKKNAAMILATQSLQDLAPPKFSSPIRRSMVTSTARFFGSRRRSRTRFGNSDPSGSSS
jgi:type IV secretion system protein VirB4